MRKPLKSGNSTEKTEMESSTSKPHDSSEKQRKAEEEAKKGDIVIGRTISSKFITF